MLAEIDTVDKIKVGIDNLLRRVVAQDRDEQSDNAFNQNGIGIAVVDDVAVLHLCREPYLGLAAVNEVLLGAVRLGERL